MQFTPTTADYWRGLILYGKNQSTYKMALAQCLISYASKHSDKLTLDELADILEVVYRIAELRGFSREKIETIRKKKAEERGTFQENLFLVRTYTESN